MHRSPAAAAMNVLRQHQVIASSQRSRTRTHEMANKIIIKSPPPSTPPCDVFINHRGIDTKRSIATLLYDHLSRYSRVRSFLDSKNMKPGDKLFDKIDRAIIGCKVGVAVFSPRYCRSYFCLHELALMMESKKKVIPIFCDVKPSELRVFDIDGTTNCSEAELKKFHSALEKAKNTVGLAFDSVKGNWSEVVNDAADIVIESLLEIEEEEIELERMRFQGTNYSSYSKN